MRNLLFSCIFFTATVISFGQDLTWENLDNTGDVQERHENSLVTVGNKMLLIGGRGEKEIDIYNITENTWSRGSQPPFEIHHMQAVALDGLVYILGGFTGSWPHETPLTHVLVYDVTEDTWAVGTKIPEDRRRGAAGVAVYNRKIYLVNGIINGHTAGWVPWLDEYDPYTNTWTVLPNAPQARDHFQAGVIGDHLYVAGGRRSGSGETGFSGTVKESYRFNLNTHSWEEIPPIPTARAGTAATVFNGRFVVLGGESDTQEAAHNEVQAFNTNSNSWESLPNLKEGRHGTQAVTMDEKLITGAGSGNRGGGPELSSFEILGLEGNFNIAAQNLQPLEKTTLQTSDKQIDFSETSVQTLTISNPSPTKAVFISYLQPGTDAFSVDQKIDSPVILAPGSSIELEISKKKISPNKDTATLFIKTLGNSAPIEIELTHE